MPIQTQVKQQTTGPVRLELKRSVFSFALIWKHWHAEGTFRSQEDALAKISEIRARDEKERWSIAPVISKWIKPDGTMRIVIESRPLLGFMEEVWDPEHSRIFNDYLHFRIRPLNEKELNQILFEAANCTGGYTIEWAKMALDFGADVNVRDAVGQTPLHRAAIRGRIDIVGLLLERGADVVYFLIKAKI